jgi:hypothetical protein
MKRALVWFVFVAGCSFPTIDRVVPADGSAGEDSSVSETAVDDSSTADSTLDDSSESDGAVDSSPPDTMMDTFVPDSDTGSCPAGSKGTDPCDCDKDGFKRADSACGGLDCDDDDDRAHPGAGFSTFAPTAKTKGDWNCDGNPEKQKKEGISCGALLGDCTVSGFTGTVPCGGDGTFITCKVVPLGCGVNTSVTSVTSKQACR